MCNVIFVHRCAAFAQLQIVVENEHSLREARLYDSKHLHAIG